MVKEQDLRVKLSSKNMVVDQIIKCKELLSRSLDSQTGIPKESKELLVQELLTNFENAVQDNVLINGQSWEDALDDGENDNLLDESIVETARRRREYPQAIVPYVVRTLKAERKLMGMFEQAVPQELEKDPVQERIMSDLSGAAQRMFKQASSMVKSQQVLQQRAEGLRQVLNVRPTPASLEVHREVFSIGLSNGEVVTKPPPLPPGRAFKRPVGEADVRACYSLPQKKLLVAVRKPD
ncbi:kinetochore-associated protein NSL1 homolog [Hypomesus transpacificus]|uniref:kinetochore-associated protein NSL1 homolog n=1 Tax=Hypomesus transpacificus TaxID=137520 RepID=UPI001F07E95C|nr:kinetochore-associated protein NSL1 homolog [Hypomesus transpacificus]